MLSVSRSHSPHVHRPNFPLAQQPTSRVHNTQPSSRRCAACPGTRTTTHTSERRQLRERAFLAAWNILARHDHIWRIIHLERPNRPRPASSPGRERRSQTFRLRAMSARRDDRGREKKRRRRWGAPNGVNVRLRVPPLGGDAKKPAERPPSSAGDGEGAGASATISARGGYRRPRAANTAEERWPCGVSKRSGISSRGRRALTSTHPAIT